MCISRGGRPITAPSITGKYQTRGDPCFTERCSNSVLGSSKQEGVEYGVSRSVKSLN